MEEKNTVYLTLYKGFVRENIEYVDKETGDTKTFNSVTLPKGTEIDGTDVSYYRFSPLFVNPSRFRGENYRDIPLKATNEVWLQKDVLDDEDQPVLDADGHKMKDTVKVMPSQIKEAVKRVNDEYFKSLADKTQEAKEASKAMEQKPERTAECAVR